MTSEYTVHSREKEFHDDWAASTPVCEVLVRECFEAPTAVENRFILSRIGSLEGKWVLDIGAGLGESSVYLALRGARVTMIDISPEMITRAQEVGQFHGVELEGRVGTGERLPADDATFDFVYIANTIHHVTDRRRLFGEIHRVLKPGGKFFSIDPIAYNPVINVYRRMATGVRTEDEAPLTWGDIGLAREFFHDVGTRMFWLATLVLFAKYYLIDRIHPNQDRYWKRILKERDSSLWWWRPLWALDSALTRIPLLRWWSWNVVMWGEK